MENGNKNKKFISEKILGREMTLKRALKYILVSILSGLTFGAAAFLAFCLVNHFSAPAEPSEESTAAVTEASLPEESPEAESIPDSGEPASSENGKETESTFLPEGESESETIPAEETTEDPVLSGEPDGEEVPAESVPETAPALSEEDVLSLISQERKNYEFTRSDLSDVLSAERSACENIASYVVTVDSIISETTWFESTIETKRSYSGVILSKNDQEILILTVPGAGGNGDNITVTFNGGAKQNAIVKSYSVRDGLLVLAVPTEGLGQEFLETCKAVPFAGTQARAAGEPVIAAGAPMGAVGSFDFGFISYAGPKEGTVDGSLLSCYAKLNSRPDLGTFLMDINGKLIGIAYEKAEDDPVSGARFITVPSISQVIDSLKRGSDLPYLGIIGMDVSFDMKYKNMPEGLYVTDVETDSPAFNAGVKRGDILVSAGEKEITGTDDYLSFLKQAKPADELNLTLKRASGGGEYTDLEITLTAGTR